MPDWSPDRIAGQLTEISNARQSMHRKWGDQSALPLERHLAFALEGMGDVANFVNGVSHHRDRMGKWTQDEQTITQLAIIKDAAWNTAANLIQLVEAVKAREASL